MNEVVGKKKRKEENNEQELNTILLAGFIL